MGVFTVAVLKWNFSASTVYNVYVESFTVFVTLTTAKVSP